MRRRFVLSMCALGAALVPLASATGVSAQTPDRVRVLHITLDGLHPSQIGADTPNLQMLRARGTWWEQARGVMASETLPNHVAMGTGTYPGRNGIVGNGGRVALGDTEEADPDLGQSDLLLVKSTGRTIEASCPDLRTAHVFSKVYVDNVFEADPVDARFPQENFNVPGSGHAPDTTTVPYLMQEVGSNGLDYLFANLGDTDRSGHIDTTGFTGVPLTQRAAIQQVDTFVGAIVQQLTVQGLWDSTVLIISSDHSMDWSNLALDPLEALGQQGRHVDIAGALDDDARTTGAFFVSENGGAGLVYLVDPTRVDADQVLADAREVILAIPGVAEALYRLPNPRDAGNDLGAVHPEWTLHETDRTGEIFVYVLDSFVVGSLTSNPIPGNHGHVETRHITAMITGGWDGVVAQSIPASDPSAIDPASDTLVLTEQAEQVDWAPTIGWLMGIPDPGVLDGGEAQWQGRVLAEAFSRQPDPVCVTTVVEPEPTETATETPTPTPTATEEPEQLPATGGGVALGALMAVGAMAMRRRG